jgi:crotonobetainyl-CoA:carnitine CoA-transferase CaiB-like acyl-CoA transferase
MARNTGLASSQLAPLPPGADVIAVERAESPSITGEANAPVNPLNRGKRSVVADLKTE